jgi:S-DNA-T family DNA segregation ATPase FtsK/SpoIIIE|tara:strand:+ start:2278 stop:4467 length:2190 start_codon:yes stop_codon:yes gene_type:complete
LNGYWLLDIKSVVKKRSKKKIKLGRNKKLRTKKTSLHSETKKGILAIVSFTLAILSFLSFFNGAGAFGQYFLKVSKLLFGQGFFLVPVVFVLIGLAIIMPRFNLSGSRRPAYRTIFIGVILFVLSVLGIFHVFEYQGGGFLGLMIGYPLMSWLGFWASLTVFISTLVISILVIFNIPLIPIKKQAQEETDLVKDEKKIIQDSLLDKKPGFWQKMKDQAEKVKDKKSEDRILGQKDSTEALLDGKKNKEVVAGGVKLSADFKLPSLDFLEKDKGQPTSGDIKANINIIKRSLENFGIEVEMAEVNVGPTVTQYTLRPAQGIKLSRITGLQNDLALALAAHPLRIEAPIPGRSLVGIEIPNRSVVLVRLRTLLEDSAYQESPSLLTFSLGRDVAGQPVFANLAQMPHLLVAGATGTGKTIALNNIIISLLYRTSPEDLKFIFIDPKRVELPAYNAIPHMLTPVIVQADKAVGSLRWAVSEMERRFALLQEAGKRDIDAYNLQSPEEKLPYIVIVIDELADLMASHGREVEGTIVRLAQMARAIGIHLIVSTQRPSVEVITGLIKANITSRISFQVASQVDSRTILDMAGAEKLLGNGDMLFLAGNSAKPRRIQGAYVTEKEVRKVTDYLRGLREPDYQEEVISGQTVQAGGTRVGLGGGSGGPSDEDELYEEAKEVVVQAGKASASLLQRRLRVGYARAARLLDILEERGVVGPADGARPREVFIDEGAIE